ncbi:hypothetical protein INS49_013318 [Diaporthe citri]|uniref:uncharacterized protein n=1 Tax=Diaporthe citri TaxID=83186 RepID=UPI001C8263ED|nr:uncharacterized protein INS49_013318 [Diaporthe citri]KAG6357441.1 hypothetical protein INS49_013318 [Diaporthe citri]
MATSDLQNSYGPEMAVRDHDLPQAVVGNGLEPMHPGQHAALAPPYSEQHAKNNQYNGSPPGAPMQPDGTGRKRRVLGLPVALFWGIVIGLVLILAIGLGVGLGVGLGQRSSSGGSNAATTSASADAATTSAPTATSSTASSSTTTSTTSATSAAATARNVEICNQASLSTDCTNLTVPVNTCVDFPSAYNDSDSHSYTLESRDVLADAAQKVMDNCSPKTGDGSFNGMAFYNEGWNGAVSYCTQN